jgi:hypothetical protein
MKKAFRTALAGLDAIERPLEEDESEEEHEK